MNYRNGALNLNYLQYVNFAPLGYGLGGFYGYRHVTS